MHTRDRSLAPLHCLMAFAQAVYVKRMVERIAVEPKQTFWILVVNTLLHSAAVDWCKVFGSWSEQTHWTNAIPKDGHKAVREQLLAKLAMTSEEWELYQSSVVNFRDQLVAHHDLNATAVAYPHYDPALAAAFFMYGELRARADQEWLGGVPPDLQRWARTVAGNMSVIVKKAFAASAELGPNVSHA